MYQQRIEDNTSVLSGLSSELTSLFIEWFPIILAVLVLLGMLTNASQYPSFKDIGYYVSKSNDVIRNNLLSHLSNL